MHSLHGHERGRIRRPRLVIGGFSLTELMITLAVLAIVLAVGFPTFQDMIQRNRVVAAANELVAALQTARMEAIRRGARVTLCPSNNGTACAASTDWSRLLVFADADADGSLDAGEVTIRDVTVANVNLVAQSSDKVIAGNNRIWFNADGLARIGANNRSGAISVCTTRLAADNIRDVAIAVSRISVAARSAANCTRLAD